MAALEAPVPRQKPTTVEVQESGCPGGYFGFARRPRSGMKASEGRKWHGPRSKASYLSWEAFIPDLGLLANPK